MINYLTLLWKTGLLILIIGSALLTSSLLRSLPTSTIEGSLLTTGEDVFNIFLPSRNINMHIELIKGVSAQLYIYTPSGSLILNTNIDEGIPKRVRFIATERGDYKFKVITTNKGDDKIELRYYLSISGLEYDLFSYGSVLIILSLINLGFAYVWRIKYEHTG